MKKILALGRQEFSEVIGDNCIYVDKTEDIYYLIRDGKYYFLSRPRRFGKSLLANTIKELFLGNKDLFKDQWIYDKWDWDKTYPVIKMSFSGIDYETLGLERAINEMVTDIALSYNIQLTKESVASRFKELIITLSQKAPVVLLIDEYDKPIIDYIEVVRKATKEEAAKKVKSKAKQNRDILKNFYSVLKDLDSKIRFLFITGVSKFSQVSIFSDLNNLTDITLDEDYAKIVGWTKEEIQKYFPDYIARLAEKFKDIFPDIMEQITTWYDGYSWDGISRLFNPVSVMNLFGKRDFRNYWFSTGTPTFLLRYIKKEDILPYHIEKNVITFNSLEKYDLDNLTILPLLFQTGYLTIKHKDMLTGELTLGYPNREVAQSFSAHFLSEHTTGKFDMTDSLLNKIRHCFMDNDIEEFIENLNSLFSKIPYTIVEKTEKYFHSLFYLVIRIIGFIIDAEVLTIKGRIDAVVKTENHIFIVEFKINQKAEDAIKQIKERNYADKYRDDKRQIKLMGINFDTETKEVSDYLVETNE